MAREGVVQSRIKEIREELVKLRYAALLHAAKGRKVEVTLTLDEYRQVTSSDCVYCGGDLPFAGYGLDRKDPSRGYSLDNVVPCCKQCNRLKSDILDARTMSGIRGLLMARRINAILKLAPLPPPFPGKIGRPRGQHPKPRRECRSWYIFPLEYVYQPDGSLRPKRVRVRLGSTDDMDFTQAVLAADRYMEKMNNLIPHG